MASFKIAVEEQVKSILMDYVGQDGVYSDPLNYIKRWDNKLFDFNLDTDLPLLAIIARQKSQWQRPRGEIGTSRELWDWQVGVYYFDVEQTDFDVGYLRLDDMTSRITNALENEPKLRGLSVPVNPTSPTGAFNEYVWNNDWQNIVWSHSGEDNYWAFTCEMNLLVQTGRN